MTDDPARGPLCQHIYSGGLRCCALAGNEVHKLVEGWPSPHRHLFEMKCFHTVLRREVFSGVGSDAEFDSVLCGLQEQATRSGADSWLTPADLVAVALARCKRGTV